MAKRRILVLSGGGTRGAFQAGAVMRLLKTLEPVTEPDGSHATFHAYLGVSVGSMNAALLAARHKDPEAQKDVLRQVWMEQRLGIPNNYRRAFRPLRFDKTLDALIRRLEKQPNWFERFVFSIAAGVARRIFKREWDAFREEYDQVWPHLEIDAEPRIVAPRDAKQAFQAKFRERLLTGLQRAKQDEVLLKNGLPIFQSLRALENWFLRDMVDRHDGGRFPEAGVTTPADLPKYCDDLQTLWQSDAPLYASFVSMFDGRFFTASTHRSMAAHAKELPGFYFLNPAEADANDTRPDPVGRWTNRDLRDAIIASAAIPVRMTLRSVRVPEPLTDFLGSKTGRGLLAQVPGPTRRACADGGLRSILPLAQALQLANVWRGEGHEVEIYCVVNASRDRTLPFENDDGFLKRGMRFMDIMQEEILSNDIKDFRILEQSLRPESRDALLRAALQADDIDVPDILTEDLVARALHTLQTLRGPALEALRTEHPDKYRALAKGVRGSRLVDHLPLALMQDDVPPKAWLIMPTFERSWPSDEAPETLTDGQSPEWQRRNGPVATDDDPDAGSRSAIEGIDTVEDLFANLLSFNAQILEGRWRHGWDEAGRMKALHQPDGLRSRTPIDDLKTDLS